MAVSFNPFLPENRLDPYPHYQLLREQEPVHKSTLLPVPVWVLTRYRDVLEALRDPRLSVDRTRSDLFTRGPVSPLEIMGEEIRRSFLQMMLFRDPPDHTRLRHLVNLAFTPRRVESLRPRIEQIVNERIDAVLAAGEMDLIADLAYPLPMTVIAEMLGIPTQDLPDFQRWSRNLVELTEPASIFVAETRERAEAALAEMRAYFLHIVHARRARPRDDLLSAMARAEAEGDRLSEDEMFAMCVLLLVAGHETTTNLIGNAVLALLRNPAERARLERDPSLADRAVEEFLRYDSVVQATARVTLEEVVIGGETIPAGQMVILSIGAANRDPEVFPNPDVLDLGRQDNPHLAFGHGAHFCLGARLARAEAKIAISGLLRRLPGLDGDTSKPDYKPTALLRGLRSLPVHF